MQLSLREAFEAHFDVWLDELHTQKPRIWKCGLKSSHRIRLSFLVRVPLGMHLTMDIIGPRADTSCDRGWNDKSCDLDSYEDKTSRKRLHA
jgi:hypothetical protein